jgi:hypothetical protein
LDATVKIETINVPTHMQAEMTGNTQNEIIHILAGFNLLS